MRTPTAIDAMARWLVFTLAGVGLFAIIPGSSFAAPAFASTRWLFALHPVQWVGVVMIVLAWLLFVVHIVRLGVAWGRDAVVVTLAVASLLSTGASVGVLLLGSLASVVATLAVVIVVNVALCVRIDVLARRVTTCPATGKAVGAVTA
ncbi:hypothetical protein [Propioniciclava sinopodophylli]|uniref:hypothetical protein n=1 Tax=Propioniciclava sinopodophylli TaxID=1837344 RepID=UPI002493B4C5|nr:hypothetical protein [Propioniciclava sinopodophylli]